MASNSQVYKRQIGRENTFHVCRCTVWTRLISFFNHFYYIEQTNAKREKKRNALNILTKDWELPATCIHHHHQEKKKKLSLMILWHLICGKEWNYRFDMFFFPISWKQNNYIQRKREKQEKKDERRRVWETKIVTPIGIHSQA